jgi:hypothetical protein
VPSAWLNPSTIFGLASRPQDKARNLDHFAGAASVARLGPSHSDDAEQRVQALTAGPLANPDGAAVVEVYPVQMLSAVRVADRGDAVL